MKNIILVEDDLDIQEIITIILTRAGYHITTYSNGKELINSNIEPVDIIILDKQLPGMDGLDVLKRLKTLEESKDIPIIMLSADPNIKTLAKEAGANDSIEKPFKIAELREMVSKYIN